jgi:predicted cobalt transporter CbtA
VGLLVAGAVSALGAALRSRGVDPPARTTAVLAATVVLGSVALWLLPDSPDRIPADVPAGLVWDFRVASLAQLATMWSVLAVVFGLLTGRDVAAPREPEPVHVR